MNEDIIRSTKEHEVVMPEGSINAVSKSGMLNMTSIEPEHRETIVQESMVTNRRISIDDDGSDGFTPVLVPGQEPLGATNVRLEGESANSHSVNLASEHPSDPRRAVVDSDERALDDPVLAPAEEPHDSVATSSVAEPDAALAALHPSPQEAVNDPQAQVVAFLADKWNEDYEGRVVKLREEVIELNQRLDRLEK